MKKNTMVGVDYSKLIGKKDLELDLSSIQAGLKVMNPMAME